MLITLTQTEIEQLLANEMNMRAGAVNTGISSAIMNYPSPTNSRIICLTGGSELICDQVTYTYNTEDV